MHIIPTIIGAALTVVGVLITIKHIREYKWRDDIIGAKAGMISFWIGCIALGVIIVIVNI